MPTYQRETSEFQVVDLTVIVDGVSTALTDADADDVDLIALPHGTRPGDDDWVAAETLEGDLGLMIDGLDQGQYAVWYRLRNRAPEEPVDIAGYVRID